MRSRMDLIISGNMVNDHGNEEVFEFGSIKVKKKDRTYPMRLPIFN
jgi:hypothetical protein